MAFTHLSLPKRFPETHLFTNTPLKAKPKDKSDFTKAMRKCISLLCAWHCFPMFHSEKQDQDHKHHSHELQVSYWMGQQKTVRVSDVIAKVLCQSALQSGVHHYWIIDKIWKNSVKYQNSPNHSVLSCSAHAKTSQSSIATKPQINSQSTGNSFQQLWQYEDLTCCIQKL